MGNFQDLLDKFGKGKEAAGDLFNMLLNRRMQNLGANDLIPSQMPGAMGGGFDHGITGNLSDIHNRPFDYGMKGGLKQMPYSYGDQGGIQQIIKQKIPAVTLDGGKTYFDPRDGSPIDMDNLSSKDFYLDSSGRGIDFGKGIEALKKGKERGGVMNDSTYEALQMLQGY